MELKVFFGVNYFWDLIVSVVIGVVIGVSFVCEIFIGVFVFDMGVWVFDCVMLVWLCVRFGCMDMKMLFNINVEFVYLFD